MLDELGARQWPPSGNLDAALPQMQRFLSGTPGGRGDGKAPGPPSTRVAVERLGWGSIARIGRPLLLVPIRTAGRRPERSSRTGAASKDAARLKSAGGAMPALAARRGFLRELPAGSAGRRRVFYLSAVACLARPVATQASLLRSRSPPDWPVASRQSRQACPGFLPPLASTASTMAQCVISWATTNGPERN